MGKPCFHYSVQTTTRGFSDFLKKKQDKISYEKGAHKVSHLSQ